MGLVLKGAHLVDPQEKIDGVFDLLIEDQKICDIAKDIDLANHEVHNLSGKYAVPGLVDMHVHFREPGFEHKEDIESGSRAAVHGGFTDVCTMANTKPVTDTGTAIGYALARAKEVSKCHIHPAGACSLGLQGDALAEMGNMFERGAVAFTDDGIGVENAGMMRRIMDYAKMFDRPVMSHCQDASLVGPGQVNEGEASTRLGLAGWPAAGEEIQIARDIALSELTGCPLHIQHLTTARGIELVRDAKKRGLNVTCEVTPHHIFLDDSVITSAYETQYKVNPPLRTKEDAQALINAVADGVVDCIVTDHAPHAAWEKDREFERAPFGMTGLETSLGLVLTYLVRPGIISYEKMVELMAIGPRKILRLKPVKFSAGSAADITIFDPDATWTVSEQDFESKSTNSGFTGFKLTGKPTDTYVAGHCVMRDGVVE